MKVEELIGTRVKVARTEAGLTQAQLGEALGGYLGKPWSNMVVSLAETGRRNFAAAELVALAVVLKRPVAWFFSPLDTEAVVELPTGPLASEDYRALGRPEGEMGTVLAEFAEVAVVLRATGEEMLGRVQWIIEELNRAGVSVPLAEQVHAVEGRVELVDTPEPAPTVEALTRRIEKERPQKKAGTTTRKGGRK
jgi:transcriptional regulator with XRE-family HTH domain